MAAIAVVMPVYNRESSVGRAIESVLAQDFADFELVVVDDGSKDGTVAAVEAFRDPRIVLLRQEANKGGNAARNRGVTSATAPIVSFLDSDDTFLPHKLGFVTRYFAARADIEVVIDSFELVYPIESSKVRTPRINPCLEDSAAVERAIFTRRLFKATPAISLRKEAAIRVGLFDETLKRRQDFDLVLRLARAARCASLSDVLWTKYWSPDAISSKDNTFVAATIDLCRRHPSYVGEKANRVGLARDVMRHFLRLAGKGQFATAIRDARVLQTEFGSRVFAGLVSDGAREIVRRRREKTGAAAT